MRSSSSFEVGGAARALSPVQVAEVEVPRARRRAESGTMARVEGPGLVKLGGGHGGQHAPPPPDAVPRTVTILRGSKARLSEMRLSARAQDALDLGEALLVSGTSRRAVAEALGVDESVVRDWCDPSTTVSPASGDIDALPGKVRAAYQAIKRARLAIRLPRTLDQLAGDVAIAAGDLARAVRSGDEQAIDRAALSLDDAALALAQRRRA